MINNINTEALQNFKNTVEKDYNNGILKSSIQAIWQSGTEIKIQTKDFKLGSSTVKHDFSFFVDEPEELLGKHSAPAPLDYFLAGLSSCMTITFIAIASSKGIKIDNLTLDIKTELDLRGFLGIDEKIPAGFDSAEYLFTVKGDGSSEELKEIADQVIKLSPNYYSITNKVKMTAKLDII
ncbi:OsmC family protein [Tenacibaculum sp. C7A-26P2]|uniref:OsmC family protein n=1 Tax=Tenacibaculum sp. C7A-26P2 TaxID=3447504 RepID=UPI003F825A44